LPIAADAELGRVSPHGLRHAGITKALELCEGNVRKAQKFSRHKDVKTLLKYDDNRQDDAGALAAEVADDIEGDEGED
jgi:integrase/recombinase XerC